MLERLAITDLALVDRAEVELAPGLNVVTGETGAGKSLLVHSVNLLVGERADTDQVREGARAAIVEGEFRLAGGIARRVGELLGGWGLDFDGETVIVRREVQSGGKSRATVNQSAVTLAALKQLGVILADLHGQHEHQSLLAPDAGIELLDRLERLDLERERYATALAAWRESRAALERLERTLADHADHRDAMRDALAEIDATQLVEGEEERLRADALRLANADRLRERVAAALDALAEGEPSALAGLGAAAHAIEHAVALDPTLADARDAIEEARIAAGEAARTLGAYAARLEADPLAIEAIESRREAIARLTRKHRRTVPELLLWRDDIARQLADGEDAEGALARAREHVDRDARDCLTAGRALSRRRRTAAREWSARLTRELKPLGLAHAEIAFAVETIEGAEASFPAAGLDHVEMRFTANPGEPPRPLARIASGGELSRVMLALKAALEAQDRVDVLIFDEVDSGIGGVIAQAVGERLRRLAQHRQIVCVTHLPMIAALATHHLRVTKHVAGGRTRVRIEPLESDARIEELARMLAGDLATSTTRRQARELIEAAGSGSTAR